MKIKFLLIIFFFASYFCQAQTELIELSDFVKDLNDVEKLKNIRGKNLKSFYILYSQVEIERDLDFDYKHLRILVVPSPGEDFIINIIHKNGVILIGNVSIQTVSRERKIKSDFYFIENSSFVKQYVDKHNLKYDSNQKEQDFYDFLMSEYTVGFGCGDLGNYINPISKETLRLIKKKNIAKLNEMLISINPELQTLGAIGLIRINKLTVKQQEIIAELKKKNSVIFSCGGCVFNFGETFSERLELEIRN